MLADMLIESKDIIEDYVYERDNKKSIANLQAYRNNVERFLKEMEDIKKIIVALKDMTTVDVKNQLAVLSGLLEKLNKGLSDVEQEKGGNNNIYEVSTFIKKLDSEYKVIWIKHYEKQYEPILNLLDMLKSLKVDPEIFTLSHKMQMNKKKWPISTQDLESVKSSHEKAAGKIDQLGLTPKIVEFLKKLIKGNIYLSDLDDEIIGWVRKENVEDKIKLNISNF